MAATWIVNALFASLLSSVGIRTKSDDLIFSKGRLHNLDGIHFVAHTNYGDLLGVKQRVTKTESVIAFLGVPYAQPPLGPLRFKKPQQPLKWSGVRDATTVGKECMQPELFNSTVPGPKSEDCLYLQVYIPDKKIQHVSFPVMVWIHGGAFMYWSGSDFDRTNLPTRDVLLVTINYRLGVFGFLSDESSIIPGNFGMMDQVLALEWIQQNIAAFGGDPNRVTIFGQSAGAGSVSLLMLSPLGQGLFSKAILESGSALSPWAIVQPATRTSSKVMAALVGSIVGCDDTESTLLLSCLQATNASQLLNAAVNASAARDNTFTFLPRVENVFGFLPDLPLRLLARGEFSHINTLRGYNTDELATIMDGEKNNSLTENEFWKYINANVLNSLSLPDKENLFKDLATLYLKNRTDPIYVRNQTARAMSDLLMDSPMLKELMIISSADPEHNHYLYDFDYKPSWDKSQSWQGAHHAEELPFVFGLEAETFRILNVSNITTTDQLVANQVMTMWTNFAKSGDPTTSIPPGAVTWQIYTNDKPRTLRIKAQSQLEMLSRPGIVEAYSKLLRMMNMPPDTRATLIG